MFLPKLAAWITRHPRQILTPGVDFEWNPECWTHNLFRRYELIFGRRFGIRLESSAMVDTITGRVVVRMHTLEMAISHLEQTIRRAWKNTLAWQPFRIYIPAFSGAIPGMPASPYLFAVAFSLSAMDNSTGVARASASVTFTVSTTNGAIISYPYNNGATEVVTSVGTSDGNSTRVNAQLLSGGGFAALWYKLGPVTASNTVTENVSPNAALTLISCSYSGVKQSGQPDSSNVGTGSGTVFNISTTVVDANSWAMLATAANTQAPADGTNFTSRQRDNTSQGTAQGDSNAVTGAGLYTMSPTSTASANFAGVIASFSPAGATATIVYVPQLLTLGVG